MKQDENLARSIRESRERMEVVKADIRFYKTCQQLDSIVRER